jgi:hypothetical protein
MPAAAVAVHTGIGHAESFTHLPEAGRRTRTRPTSAYLPDRIGAAVACPRLEPRRGT